MQQYVEFAGNHPILVVIWIGLLLAIIVSYIQAMFSKLQFVTPTELTLLVNREDALVLDIRSNDDFKRGHITGARNIPLAQLSGQIGSLEKAKDAPIIVVCQAGMSAQGAAKQLSAAGFSRVAVLTGGMGKWAEASLPVVKNNRSSAMSSPSVTIYTKEYCPYCVRAKALLSHKGVEFHEIKIDAQPELRPEMITRAGGRSTVPQIFINDQHIGGCDDLHALDAQGRLDTLLQL